MCVCVSVMCVCVVARAPCKLGKCSPIELQPRPITNFGGICLSIVFSLASGLSPKEDCS